MKEDINSENDEEINNSNNISSVNSERIDFFSKEKEPSKNFIDIKEENENENEENNDIDLETLKLGSKIICPEDNCFSNSIISINPILFEVKSDCGKHKKNQKILNFVEKSGKSKEEKECCSLCKKTLKEIEKNNTNAYICYCGKNICENCKENHLKEKDIDVQKHIMTNIKLKDYTCCCKKDNKKFTTFCLGCKKNLCNLCNKDHKEHKIKKFSELFKLKKDEKKEFKKKLDEQKVNIDKIKNIIDAWLERTKKFLERYKKELELYWEINNIIFNKYDIAKNFYEEIKNIENIRDDFDNHFMELLKSENDFKKQNDIIFMLLNENQYAYKNKKENKIIVKDEEKEFEKIKLEKLSEMNYGGNIMNICELKKKNFLIVNISYNKKEELYIYKKSENKIYDQIHFISAIEGGKIISLTELKNGNLLIVQKKYFKIIRISTIEKEINIIQNQNIEAEDFIQIIELINGYLASISFNTNGGNNIILWEKNLLNDLYENKVEDHPIKKPIFIMEINKDSFLVYFIDGFISIYSSKKNKELYKLNKININGIKNIIPINEEIILLIYSNGVMIYNLSLKKNSKFFTFNYNLNDVCSLSNNIFLANFTQERNFGLIPLIYDSFLQKIVLGDKLIDIHINEISKIILLSSGELVTASKDKFMKIWKIKKNNVINN